MEYNLKHYAYIGDCVWELFIRKLVINKTQVQKTMHQLTTKYVRAEFQSEIIEKIIPELNDCELEIQKRGRNLKISINKKHNPKMHALATSFEVLIGYLYLNNQKRLDEILDFIKPDLSELN